MTPAHGRAALEIFLLLTPLAHLISPYLLHISRYCIVQHRYNTCRNSGLDIYYYIALSLRRGVDGAARQALEIKNAFCISSRHPIVLHWWSPKHRRTMVRKRVYEFIVENLVYRPFLTFIAHAN